MKITGFQEVMSCSVVWKIATVVSEKWCSIFRAEDFLPNNSSYLTGYKVSDSTFVTAIRNSNPKPFTQL
jgi:hypothetical protein